MDVRAVAAEIDLELEIQGTLERAAQEKAYLKSELEHYGTTVPDIRSVVKSVCRRASEIGHDELVDLAVLLWAEPIHESRMATVELLILHKAMLEPGDIGLIERLLRDSRTWALVDGLATSVVANLVERHPDLGDVLDRWGADPDFWIRRSALLALLVPLRRGEGDFERFSRYADAMLDEREFFIRKAIGWVLRDTARRRPDLVFGWILPRAARASGVTLREAVKYLSQEQRTAVLAAR